MYDFFCMDVAHNNKEFIGVFHLTPDTSRPGRVLSSVRIGDVFMSRLEIQPGVICGNYYHKETDVILYAEQGQVIAAFEHVETKEKTDCSLDLGQKVVHVPAYIAHGTKNVGTSLAVVVFLSNKPLRSDDDCYSYPVLF